MPAFTTQSLRSSATFVTAVAGLLFVPASALPCSCLRSPSPCATVGTSTVVFVGTPVAVQANGTRWVHNVRFQIDEPIQNIGRETIEVTTARDTGACGFPFSLGVKYLVYAFRDGGSYHVSLCSRTGRLDARYDDLELLRQTAAGVHRPRLSGVIYRLQLRLDGLYMHHDRMDGVANVPVRITGRGQPREVRTDQNGRFSIDGLAQGSYAIDLQLPSRYSPLFDERITAGVVGCFGEVSVPVTTVPLRGTVGPAPGEERSRKIMLRIARVEPTGSVSLERSTLAFTEPDGTWTVPGLPAGRYVVGVSTLDPPTPHTPYPVRWHPMASTPKDATVIEVTDDRTISIEFQLPRRIPEITVSGRTVAPDGTPIPDASVSLHDADATGRLARVSSTTSDQNGRFSITGLRGRRYRIQGTEVRPGGGTSDLIYVTDETVRRGVDIVVKP